jgi:FMN phosphatase YigB (HAD superfamily)
MHRDGQVIEVYLFDWGDTLMVDFPGVSGKMCDWDIVEAVDGAYETLECISKSARIYIATGAAESTEMDIQKALERVGLSQFISGYFCKANLGFCKGAPEFLPAIIGKLDMPSSHIAMVGDDLAKDVVPALAAGIKAIWFTSTGESSIEATIQTIGQLRELCHVPDICD